MCLCYQSNSRRGRGKKTLIANAITSKPLKVILNGNINGIDVEYFNCSREVMNHRKLIKEENTFDYIFVGRMVKDKGVNELIHAFLKLYTFYPSVRLHLVGDFERNLDPVADDVQQIIKENSAIRVWGFQNDVRPFLLLQTYWYFLVIAKVFLM